MGATASVLDLAVDYAQERTAFDIAIGAFQAISHPLVDAATDLNAGRRLVRKAAWYVDHEPDGAPWLVHAAYAHAARSATRAMRVAIHTHGGVGVSVESDLQLYFRRSKAWPLQAGDPQKSVDALGALLARATDGAR
jgi:alkylation response protein AidB-like acyl-CoA dehydrogenase